MTKLDAADGAYWYYADHHTGQFSEGYRRLCLLEKYFCPGPLAYEPESDAAMGVYQDMVKRKVCLSY